MHYVFSRTGVGRTLHRGGLLIYLSLFERRLEIHGDMALADTFSTADFESIRNQVLAKVREGRIADGLIAGLDEAEKLLAERFPKSKSDERPALSNEVLVFHPRP